MATISILANTVRPLLIVDQMILPLGQVHSHRNTQYSHLSNKRDVTLTDFEKFHPTRLSDLCTSFSKKFHPPRLFQPPRLVIWPLLHPLLIYSNLHVY